MRILAGIVRALMPDADLKQRAEEVEVRGSTDNKLALAGECSAHQMHGEAIRLYESCLQGGYSRGDSTILFRLAGAAVDAVQWDKADGAIARLKSEAPKMRPLEVRLLEARVLEGRDRGDAAVVVYQEILPAFLGLEARYRYGSLLIKLGKREAALEMFGQVVELARRFAAPIKEEERWLAAAKQALRDG